jgi:hypothetical protein
MLLQFRPISRDQPLRIDEIDLVLCVLLRHALQREEAHDLLGNTNTSTSSTKEEHLVVSEGTTRGFTGQFGGVDETGEHDCTGTLDIVVEDGDLRRVSVSFEVVERMLGAYGVSTLKVYSVVGREDTH